MKHFKKFYNFLVYTDSLELAMQDYTNRRELDLIDYAIIHLKKMRYDAAVLVTVVSLFAILFQIVARLLLAL